MPATIDPPELGYVGSLFLVYLGLWQVRRVQQRRATGADPQVLGRSTRPTQRYFAQLLRVLNGAVVLLVIGHASGIAWPGFRRFPALDVRWADHAGFALALLGLGHSFLAQRTMGPAWRVGIDESARTPLVDSGIYAHARNPMYLGMFAMNAGLWLIWPTASIAAFALVFFVVMDMQVRCEEEYLEALHGQAFRSYRDRTWRYVPFVY